MPIYLPAYGTSQYPFFHVDSFGADPTNTQDSTNAFLAANTAAMNFLGNTGAQGASIVMGQGQYRLTCGNFVVTDPRIEIAGPGRFKTTVWAYGLGDAIKYGTSSFATRHSGSRVGGFLLDGTNTTGTSNGVRVTDLGDVHYNDLFVTKFTQANSIGILCDTTTGWSERMLWTGVDVTNNAIGVCFDGGASGTSYDYQHILDLYLGISTSQVGLLLRNFAQLDQPILHMRFNAQNFPSNQAASTLIQIGTSNAAGEQSRIRDAHFAIRGELGGAGSNSPCQDLVAYQNTEFTGSGVFKTFGLTAGSIQTKNISMSGLCRTPAFGPVYEKVSAHASGWPTAVVKANNYLTGGTSGTGTNGAWTLGTLWFVPVDVIQPQTFTGLACGITALGSGGTTPLVLMGLYPTLADLTGPNVTGNGPTLQTMTTPTGFDTTKSFDPTTGSTGTIDLAWSTPQTLYPGRYWIAWVLSSGTAMGAQPTFVTMNPLINVGAFSMGNNSSRSFGINGVATGTLPSTGSVVLNGGAVPFVGLKAQ